MVNNRKNQGFTLIEVMIVVAIVGILAAVAYPSYQESIRKSKRAEGRTALMEVLQQQERYMTQNNTYLAFSSGSTTAPFRTYSGDKRASTSYLLEAKACTNQDIKDCVQIIGTPQYSDPAITTLIATSTGVKSCTGSNTAVCWK